MTLAFLLCPLHCLSKNGFIRLNSQQRKAKVRTVLGSFYIDLT